MAIGGQIRFNALGAYFSIVTVHPDDDDCFHHLKSVLVPLIEGLCAQILYFRFEIIGGLRSHLLLFFFETKHMLKKKAVSPRSHPAS